MDVGAHFRLSASVTGQAQLDRFNDALMRSERMSKTVDTSVKQTAAAMRTLPAQFTDIATQLAGGQSPFLILLQQGGQIRDSFGGIGNAARAVASTLTPLRVGAGGAAVVLGVLAKAAFDGQQEINDLNRSLALTGNYAGATLGSYDRMKNEIADVVDVSRSASKELLAAAMASASFGPGVLQPAVEAMARIQKLSGQSSDDIVKDFARMRDGVAKWAAEHNRQYNYITAEQYKRIKQLEDEGNAEAAMRENMKLLNEAFKNRTVELGYLETAWVKVKSAAADAWDAMLGIGRPDTPDERLASLSQSIEANRKILKQLDSVNNGAGFFKQDVSRNKAMAEERIRQAQAEIDAIRAKAKAEQDAAAATAKRNAEEQQQIKQEDERARELPRIRAAQSQLALQQAQNAAQARINAYEVEEAQLERLRQAGFLNEREYAERTSQVKADKLRASIRLAEQEIAIEQSKEASSEADMIQRAARVAALQGRVSELKSQVTVVGIQAKGQVAAATAQASKEFDDFNKRTREQIQRLVLENNADAARLIADPIKRQRAELDAEIAKIREKYDEIIIPVRLKLEGASGAEAADLQRQLDELNRERDRAVKNKTDSEVDKSSPFAGIREGMKEIANEVQDRAASMKNVLVNAFESAADALTEFVMTGKLNFGDLARSILADLARMIVKQQLFNALSAVTGSFTGGGGGNAPGGILSAVGSLFGFANGGAFNDGVQAFASGGVVSQPTLFKFASGGRVRTGLMGEAGDEAIMPLARDSAGRLGVRAQGGGGRGDVNIAVSVDASGRTSSSGGEGALDRLGSLVGAAVRDVIIKEQRPGGLLYGN